MTAPYLTALGLEEPPFSKEIPDADLWLPASKQGAADGLIEAIAERASVVLGGEPGVSSTHAPCIFISPSQSACRAS